MLISLSSDPLIGREIPHFLATSFYNHIPLGTFFLPGFSYPGCKQYSSLLGRKTPMNIAIKVFLHMGSCQIINKTFKRGITTTYNGCTKLVHPGVMSTVVVLHSEDNKPSMEDVFCALCWSSKSIVGPSTWGFLWCLTYWIIPDSSHHAFSWKHTKTHLSYFNFWKVIRFPVPLRITSGLTQRIPPAKRISWMVHWRFSNPEFPPCTHTELVPLASYIKPFVKVNGNGV